MGGTSGAGGGYDGGPLVLVIRIEAGEPITGTLRAEGESAPRRFAGWVELMAQITAARQRHGQRH